MPYDPNKHNRRSLRLHGYDYTQAGAYFVTICVQDRHCAFGKVIDGIMRQSPIGEVAYRFWQEISDHYPRDAGRLCRDAEPCAWHRLHCG